jgi:hypothetical protein
MKASALLIWATVAGLLGHSLGNGSGEIPFKKLYRFQTVHGPVYIAEWKKRFYPLFRGESLGSYATAEDAAEDLAYGGTLALPGIDIRTLRIPKDLKKWERL